MSDDPDLKTKTDVMDLIINFLREHERNMDEIVERLEKISKKISKISITFLYSLSLKYKSPKRIRIRVLDG